MIKFVLMMRACEYNDEIYSYWSEEGTPVRIFRNKLEAFAAAKSRTIEAAKHNLFSSGFDGDNLNKCESDIINQIFRKYKNITMTAGDWADKKYCFLPRELTDDDAWFILETIHMTDIYYVVQVHE